MALCYSDGQLYYKNASPVEKIQEKRKQITEFGNRGMCSEEAINESNEYYLSHGLTVIHGKPTLTQIVKVDHPKRNAAVTREVYFTQASTTDYNGVYRGSYSDSEVKEAKNKTSSPSKNFHAHQIEYMKACLEQRGVCFVLSWSPILKRCFYLNSVHLIAYWDAQKEKGCRSLPLSLIEELGIEIKTGISPRIPYLDAVDLYSLTLSIEGEGKDGK